MARGTAATRATGKTGYGPGRGAPVRKAPRPDGVTVGIGLSRNVRRVDSALLVFSYQRILAGGEPLSLLADGGPTRDRDGMDDQGPIVDTVRNYWQGWFDGDPDRMRRALHPELVKRGAAIDGTPGKLTAVMTAENMIGWAREGEGIATRPADDAYDITVNDVHDQIATVTVRSAIYREYLQLVKTDEGWRILNALYMNVV